MVENPKLICVIGRTCSGKDTLARFIKKYSGIPALVSYTTRPKRDHEIHDKDHYFITEEEYKNDYADKEKMAYTEINGYRYFTLYEQLTEGKRSIHSYIIDPNGYYMLRDKYGDRIQLFTIYVKCSKDTQMRRYNNREKKISIPFSMRDVAEDEEFYLFEQNDLNSCDIIVNTDNVNLVQIMSSVVIRD